MVLNDASEGRDIAGGLGNSIVKMVIGRPDPELRSDQGGPTKHLSSVPVEV